MARRQRKFETSDEYNARFQKEINKGNTVITNLQKYKEATYKGNYAEADKYYKKVVKAVDQQLVRLEQLHEQGIMLAKAKQGNKKAISWVERHHVAKDADLFIPVTDYAYQSAMESLRELGMNNRFNVKVSDAKKRSVIAVAEHFLMSSTNTKGKIVKMYKKKAETFNKKYDTNFTWQELSNFFNSSLYEELQTMNLSSNTIFTAVGKLKTAKDPKDMIEKIKDGSKQTTFSDSPEDEVTKRLISEGVFDDFVKTMK